MTVPEPFLVFFASIGMAVFLTVVAKLGHSWWVHWNAPDWPDASPPECSWCGKELDTAPPIEHEDLLTPGSGMLSFCNDEEKWAYVQENPEECIAGWDSPTPPQTELRAAEIFPISVGFNAHDDPEALPPRSVMNLLSYATEAMRERARDPDSVWAHLDQLGPPDVLPHPYKEDIYVFLPWNVAQHFKENPSDWEDLEVWEWRTLTDGTRPTDVVHIGEPKEL